MAFGAIMGQTPDLTDYVKKTGDTLTGPLLYDGVPSVGTELVNKDYVDNNFFNNENAVVTWGNDAQTRNFQVKKITERFLVLTSHDTKAKSFTINKLPTQGTIFCKVMYSQSTSEYAEIQSLSVPAIVPLKYSVRSSGLHASKLVPCPTIYTSTSRPSLGNIITCSMYIQYDTSNDNTAIFTFSGASNTQYQIYHVEVYYSSL